MFGSWPWILCLMGVVFFLLNIYAFYPGFMSNDSLDQLQQSLGDKPLQNWHPPVMAVWWWLLIRVTHLTGSLLIWHVGMLWLALTIFAAWIYRQTGSRKLSAVPVLIGLMPFVVNISGVIWKDVGMAYSLLLASVLLIVARDYVGKVRFGLIIIAFLLMVYAASLRYNSFFAVVPLFWFCKDLFRYKYIQYVLAVGCIVAVVFVNALLGAIHPVQNLHPASNTMIDDIVHVYSRRQLADLDAPPAFHDSLLQMVNRCDLTQLPVSVMVGCATEQDRRILTQAYYSNLQSVWLSGLVHHPVKYIGYRASTFVSFLHPPFIAQSYVWQKGIEPANPYGLTAQNNWLTRFIHGYVDFAALDFGLLYHPYTWLLAAITLIGVVLRRGGRWTHRPDILILSISGMLYILSYLPLVAAYDFRYIYWSVLAISVAGMLMLLDHSSLPKHGTQS
jgi:hypothetical protein